MLMALSLIRVVSRGEVLLWRYRVQDGAHDTESKAHEAPEEEPDPRDVSPSTEAVTR